MYIVIIVQGINRSTGYMTIHRAVVPNEWTGTDSLLMVSMVTATTPPINITVCM